jgi:hypothetical protein
MDVVAGRSDPGTGKRSRGAGAPRGPVFDTPGVIRRDALHPSLSLRAPYGVPFGLSLRAFYVDAV